MLNGFYRSGAVLAASLLACAQTSAVLHAQSADRPQCRPAGHVITIDELSEASGIAASRRSPGTVWALNDSGEPVIYALDADGTVTGRVRLTGAKVDDWEAIAVGPCAGGSCLYVGDIGDNNGTRREITIYRLAEPAASGDSTATAEVIRATYPDGPQDAESLLITPDGSLFVVTKGVKGSVALYRFPRDLRAGSSVQLQHVAKPRDRGKTSDSDRVTDAAASPQGDWIVLRTNRALTFHRTKELMAGNWRPASVVDLAGLNEPQGEAVTFGPSGTIVVAGEGGGKSKPGTVARLSCGPLR